MKKKKRGFNVHIHLTNRWLYTFIALGILAIIGVGVWALTPGVKPNPGHLTSEMAPPNPCSSGQFLKFDGTNWICASAGDSDWIISGSDIYSGVSGNVGIGTSSPGVKLDVAGTTAVDYLRIDPQDGTNEGGELQLIGAGSYGTLQIDNFQGNARIHTLSSGKFFEIVGGDGIKTSGYLKFFSEDFRLRGVYTSGSGTACDTLCGNGYCLGAYTYGSKAKTSCSSIYGSRYCLCVGYP